MSVCRAFASAPSTKYYIDMNVRNDLRANYSTQMYLLFSLSFLEWKGQVIVHLPVHISPYIVAPQGGQTKV